MKNIDCQRTSGVDLRPEWINKKSLMFKVPKKILEQIGIATEKESRKSRISKRHPSIIDCKTQDGHPSVEYQSRSPKRSRSQSRSQSRTKRKNNELSVSKSQKSNAKNKSSSKIRTSGVNQTLMTTYEDS